MPPTAIAKHPRCNLSIRFTEADHISFHECKGGYSLHSQQRARLAFDQCAKEFPGFRWFWAVKKPEGWEITHA